MRVGTVDGRGCEREPATASGMTVRAVARRIEGLLGQAERRGYGRCAGPAEVTGGVVAAGQAAGEAVRARSWSVVRRVLTTDGGVGSSRCCGMARASTMTPSVQRAGCRRQSVGVPGVRERPQRRHGCGVGAAERVGGQWLRDGQRGIATGRARCGGIGGHRGGRPAPAARLPAGAAGAPGEGAAGGLDQGDAGDNGIGGTGAFAQARSRCSGS